MSQDRDDVLIKFFKRLLSRIFLSTFKYPPGSKEKFKLKDISERSGGFSNSLSKSTQYGEDLRMITFLSYYKSYCDLAKSNNTDPLAFDDFFTEDCKYLLELIIALKDFSAEEEGCSAIEFLIDNYFILDNGSYQDSILGHLRPQFETIKDDKNFSEFKPLINTLLEQMEE